MHAQFDRVINALEEKLPKVADHLEAARHDVLAFTPFPKGLWRQVWSNNPTLISSPCAGRAADMGFCVVDGVFDAAA